MVLALSLGCSDSPTGPGGTPLVSGQSRILSGGTGSERAFTIEVPAGTGTLRVQLMDGTGDADLVIRHGARPETGLYDCVSESFENVEECLIDEPEAGTWHVLVVGHEAYSQVRLLATLGAQAGAVLLQNNVPVTELSGGAGSFRMFRIVVPAGATVLDVQLDGAGGDADLYVRRGSFPLLNSYDCASFGDTSTERCLVPGPTAGTYYIRVEGFLSYTGVTLTALH